jgi:hypothetical protein
VGYQELLPGGAIDAKIALENQGKAHDLAIFVCYALRLLRSHSIREGGEGL